MLQPSQMRIFGLLLFLLSAALGSKYSKEANEGASEAAQFRLVRLNQVWEKAQRLHLSAVKLAELHSDLKIQEKDELQWKKLKAEGLDEDGEKEAKLRRNLDVILAKYGMNGKKDAPPGATNYIKDGLEEEDLLDDLRLVKLWNKAKASGKFSEEELEKLWREFRHHKEKVHEYNILMEAVSRTEDLHKNMITALEDEAEDTAEASPFKEERLHRKHSELKEKLHSINQGFERLRRVTHQGFDADSEFQEPRVIDLWDMAKSTNFTEKELESLREELKHFEAKVEKHLHFQKQLEISHQKLKHVEGTSDREHLTKHREKHSALEEKTKDLGYKDTEEERNGRRSRATKGQPGLEAESSHSAVVTVPPLPHLPCPCTPRVQPKGGAEGLHSCPGDYVHVAEFCSCLASRVGALTALYPQSG